MIPYIIDYTIDVYATKFNLRTQKLDKVFLVRHSPAPGYTGYWGAEICGSYFEFKRDDPQVDSIYGYLVDFDNKVLVKTYSMKRKLNRK